MGTPRSIAPTPREQAVLQLLADGYGLKQAAHQLGVQLSTVNSYIRTLKQRLGAKTAPHAVFIAIQKGYIHVD